MDVSLVPRLNGYTRVNSHPCPRCGALARALYVRNFAYPPARENATEGYQERRFGAGTLLVSAAHVDNGYGGWYGYQVNHICGYIVPSSMNSPETFIQQLYERLPYNGNRPTERIVRFDVAAFLAQPWILHAPAFEPGEPEIILLPHPNLLRVILARGIIPSPQTHVTDLSAVEQLAARSQFLAVITAETESRAF
jgi:hypothetical protein